MQYCKNELSVANCYEGNFWFDTCLHMPGCTEKQPHELNMTFMGEAKQKKMILNVNTVIIMKGN